MCVHVLCGCALPDNSVVWVDSTGKHNLVYVDPSLCGADGQLTQAGRARINEHLAQTPGVPSLESAVSCR